MIITFAAFSSNAESAPPARTQKPGQNSTPLAKAQAAYTQGNFDEAIKNYRKHLRSYRADFNTWNLLGTAYYHTGQAEKALEYLRYAAPRTTQRSHNAYYQGLAYLALNKLRLARQRLQTAANFNDEFGEKAAYELAVIEFNARQKDAATYWVKFYQQRYAKGPNAKTIDEMALRLNSEQMTMTYKGNDKVDMDDALYRYHSWSLSPRTHYWLAQLGYEYANGSEQNPVPGGGLTTGTYEDQALLARAGIGIGPVRKDQYTSWAGYHYNQRWVTDTNRLLDYFEAPTDIEYLPYRADVMERRHQVLGEVTADVHPMATVGAFAKIEFARVGSTYFPSPEDQDLRKVFRMSDSTLIVPWARFNYMKRYQTDVHLYLRKELNEDMPESSNKTYNIFDDGEKAMSLGVNQRVDLPEYKLWLNFSLFRYEFIYNDTWFDFTRLGFAGAANYEFYRNFFVRGLLATYSDDYKVPRLKQFSCSYVPDATGGDAPSTSPLQCQRKDTGLIYQAGIYWNYTQFYQLSSVVTFTENRNSQQKIFDRTKFGVVIMGSMAFPNITGTIQRAEKFSDVIETKETD